MTGILEDSHLLELSKWITSKQELWDIGTRVLNIQEQIIDAALHNQKTSIQDAAYSLLDTWIKGQSSRQEAYVSLQSGLKRCHMNQIASNLRMWVEGIENVSQLTDERKFFLQTLRLLSEKARPF